MLVINSWCFHYNRTSLAHYPAEEEIPSAGRIGLYRYSHYPEDTAASASLWLRHAARSDSGPITHKVNSRPEEGKCDPRGEAIAIH